MILVFPTLNKILVWDESNILKNGSQEGSIYELLGCKRGCDYERKKKYRYLEVTILDYQDAVR